MSQSTSLDGTGTAPTDTTPPVFTSHLDARWGDLDAFNHVNNAAYLVYLQEARILWMQSAPDWHGPAGMPVVASALVNYRRPISWPQRLAVEMICTRLGTTSITLAHRIVSADDAACLFADGHVVMVWVDPASGQPASLPTTIRTALGAAPMA